MKILSIINKIQLFNISPILLIVLLMLVSGCSKHVDYRVGIVTRSVSGEFSVKGKSEEVQPFVIVRKYNRTLIQDSAGGYLYRVSADLVFPTNGRFTVDMAAGVDRVELMFLGRYHTPVTYQFRRTLGVGKYVFNASLNKDPSWKESYFLLIKPILTDYIVEPRFELSHSKQLYLGQWMDKTEAEFFRHRVSGEISES